MAGLSICVSTSARWLGSLAEPLKGVTYTFTKSKLFHFSRYMIGLSIGTWVLGTFTMHDKITILGVRKNRIFRFFCPPCPPPTKASIQNSSVTRISGTFNEFVCMPKKTWDGWTNKNISSDFDISNQRVLSSYPIFSPFPFSNLIHSSFVFWTSWNLFAGWRAEGLTISFPSCVKK